MTYHNNVYGVHCRDADAGVDSTSEWLTCDNVDTSSDLLLAQMLQFELDAEHDLQLKREEDKFNGTSKGYICDVLLLILVWFFGGICYITTISGRLTDVVNQVFA